MAMTDAEPLFIDTNILIYANVATAPLHEQALSAIKEADQAGRPLWISRQVLREFIAARTRPQTFGSTFSPGSGHRTSALPGRALSGGGRYRRCHQPACQIDGGF